MTLFDGSTLGLLVLVLGAAVVNGSLGYGFSSIVTPVVLLWTTSRVLNPAVILVELGINLALLVRERRYLRATFSRSTPLLASLLPGVVLGSVALAAVAPEEVNLVVYATMLPLILVQLIGLRRFILNERPVGAVLGGGVGFLYSLTTISGLLLALFWRNQGMAKGEFRCAMAQVRVAEAPMTAVVYGALGLYTPASMALLPWIAVPVLIGVPLGLLLVRAVTRGLFSRLVMAADALLVSFGLLATLGASGYLTGPEAMLLFLLATGLVLALLWREAQRLPFLTVSPRFEDRSFGPGPLG